MGLGPPPPFHQIDLLTTVRSSFAFHRNKLESVLRELEMENKVEHKGMDLWSDCMEGEEKSQRHMERYNRGDVRVTETLYKKILPWIRNHPNHALYDSDTEGKVCRNCGACGDDLSPQGYRQTSTQIYPRFKCKKCGTWGKDRFNCTPIEMKHNILAQA